MTPEAERVAVLRHLWWIESLGATPADVDAFLGLENGTSGAVIASIRDCAAARKRRNAEKALARKRKWNALNRERKNQKAREYAAANREKLRAQERARYAANPEGHRQKVREWREANKESVRARRRARYAADPEKWKKAAREWWAKHKAEKQAHYQANRARIGDRNKAWAKANPDAVRAFNRNRKARLKGAEGTHTANDIEAQYIKQRGLCHWCGVDTGKLYHVDHVIPISRGGRNDPDNLVIACPRCNMSKQDHTPDEWKGY